MPSFTIRFPGRKEKVGRGNRREGPRQVSYLVDAELPLEAAAHPVVQRDLHRVVDVPHFMPAHLILDVEPDHCRGQGEKSHEHPEKQRPLMHPLDGQAGPPATQEPTV